MAQPPPKRLPKNITAKSDAEFAEAVFGKRIKKELDRIAGIAKSPTTPK